MVRGGKSKHAEKQERQAEHIAAQTKARNNREGA
jgi:hypothetical protein